MQSFGVWTGGFARRVGTLLCKLFAREEEEKLIWNHKGAKRLRGTRRGSANNNIKEGREGMAAAVIRAPTPLHVTLDDYNSTT